ncbi:MAG: methyltransferase domain-containing protein [Verrucomicrobiaceae bacterium]|nr:methyltransferase domain-containing protein [Verrucomicrobiaceae bacterium]
MTSSTALGDYKPTLDGTASHYDDLDQFYREIWGEHVHHGLWLTGQETDTEATENLVKMAAKLGGTGKGSDVCDIGCGYGATAKILAERYGADVTGMTISSTQWRYAQEHNHVPGKTTYLQRDWYENQLPDNRFDVVETVESLEHMPDLPTFFRECYRVMKPGGRLVAMAWMGCENPSALSKRFLIDAITREGQIAGVRPESEFRAATLAAGFTNYQFHDYAQQVKKTWPLCAWRTVKGFFTKPHYRSFLFSAKNPNRVFAITLFRIWLAYELGVMRYGVFSADKPAS